MSLAERKAYIDAVRCLMDRPSQIPPGLAPGAISRYDDFTATHINMTLKVHGDGLFLTWHRHFVYLFHRELEEKCDYRGTSRKTQSSGSMALYPTIAWITYLIVSDVSLVSLAD